VQVGKGVLKKGGPPKVPTFFPKLYGIPRKEGVGGRKAEEGPAGMKGTLWPMDIEGASRGNGYRRLEGGIKGH
jgi:hypothetical protein